MKRFVIVAVGLALVAVACAPEPPPDPNTIRVSGTSAGEENVPATSDDGNIVAFQSPASDLVPGDANGSTDVFVRDVRAGTFELISRAPDGTQLQGDSQAPCASDDGRFVAFFNKSDRNIYLRDRATQTTQLINVDSDENRIGDSRPVTPSCTNADGRYVVFVVGGMGYRRDTLNGVTEPVAPTETIDISDDGNIVSMATMASLLPGDRNGWFDVYTKNLTTGELTLASSYPDGSGAVGVAVHNGLSGNGRYVLIETYDRFLPTDQNNSDDLYVRDLQTGQMELVSVGADGLAVGINCCRTSAISDDGMRVDFTTPAALSALDTNGFDDAYVRDRARGTTELVSLGLNGTAADNLTKYAHITGDGRYAYFTSLASNLVAGDDNSGWDVFRRYVP